MAPILNPDPQNQQIIIFNSNMLEDSSEDFLEEYEEKMSLWIKERDIFRASTNLTVLNTLEPGIYTVYYDRETGMYCKKSEPLSDELFTFSDSITTQLMDEISLFWDKSELYEKNKLLHKRGILLEGFPGTGKSSIISLLSAEIIKKGGIVFKVNGYRNLSIYVDFMLSSFRKIQPDTPVITILEDLDQYNEVESELLDFLDGKTHINHHVVIATSNNTLDIPDTFLRPSRIDLKIEIPLPSEETRREYFIFKQVPSEDIENLISQSDKFSLADLKEFYISIYLLGYSVEDAAKKISSPRDKKDYSKSPSRKTSISI